MRGFIKGALGVLAILVVIKLWTDWPEGVLDESSAKVRNVIVSSLSTNGSSLNLPFTRAITGEKSSPLKQGNVESGYVSKGVYKNTYFGMSVPLPYLWLVNDGDAAEKLLTKGPAWRPNETETDGLKKGQYILLMCTKGRMDVYGQQDNAMMFITATRLPSGGYLSPQVVCTKEVNAARSDERFDAVVSEPEEFSMGGRNFARVHYRVKSYVITTGGRHGTTKSTYHTSPSLIGGSRSTPVTPIQCVVFATVADGYALEFLFMSKNEDALAEAIGSVRKLQFDPA